MLMMFRAQSAKRQGSLVYFKSLNNCKNVLNLHSTSEYSPVLILLHKAYYSFLAHCLMVTTIITLHACIPTRLNHLYGTCFGPTVAQADIGYMLWAPMCCYDEALGTGTHGLVDWLFYSPQ